MSALDTGLLELFTMEYWAVVPGKGQQPYFLHGVAIISQVEQGLNQVVAAPGGHILFVVVRIDLQDL